MPRLHKYRLLLDEACPLRSYFPRLNSIHNLKHVSKDLKKSGINDSEVFSLAAKLKRIIVTYNYKDFEELLAENKNTGIIGVSTSLSLEQQDKKITALLSKSKPNDLYGKFVIITGETR